jgi:2-polyprenyl-6-methoxyphenol hydroxylase-like FAD-dependent oxidoreductase
VTFRDFAIDQARRLPAFQLRMQAEALDVLEEAGRVVGVTYRDQDGAVHQVRARLTVAADGRDSGLRCSAGMRPTVFGAPMDVLWFRLPRRPTDPTQTFGRLATGHLLVLIDRGAPGRICEEETAPAGAVSLPGDLGQQPPSEAPPGQP